MQAVPDVSAEMSLGTLAGNESRRKEGMVQFLLIMVQVISPDLTLSFLSAAKIFT